MTAVASDPRAPQHILDPVSGRGYIAISSSTDPRLMARMLDALVPAPGMRGLEIGTGTGYNAALLAYLVGADNVTSVEVDAGVAERARRALDEVGYPVRVVTSDGAHGYPAGSPYDRVIVTASAESPADAWVRQTRPGGVIVMPWSSETYPDAPLGVVTVAEGAVSRWSFSGLLRSCRSGVRPHRDHLKGTPAVGRGARRGVPVREWVTTAPVAPWVPAVVATPGLFRRLRPPGRSRRTTKRSAPGAFA